MENYSVESWNECDDSGFSSPGLCENSSKFCEPGSGRRGRPKAAMISNLMKEGLESQSGIRCEICNRVFPRDKSLQAHLRVHTGERPYSCDYPGCVRKFKQSGQLKTHQRLHTGERPFQCSADGCKNRFTHANRHCTLHPSAALVRCDNITPYNPDTAPSQEIKHWLLRYMSEKRDGRPEKKCQKPEDSIELDHQIETEDGSSLYDSGISPGRNDLRIESGRNELSDMTNLQHSEEADRISGNLELRTPCKDVMRSPNYNQSSNVYNSAKYSNTTVRYEEAYWSGGEDVSKSQISEWSTPQPKTLTWSTPQPNSPTKWSTPHQNQYSTPKWSPNQYSPTPKWSTPNQQSPKWSTIEKPLWSPTRRCERPLWASPTRRQWSSPSRQWVSPTRNLWSSPSDPKWSPQQSKLAWSTPIQPTTRPLVKSLFTDSPSPLLTLSPRKRELPKKRWLRIARREEESTANLRRPTVLRYLATSLALDSPQTSDYTQESAQKDPEHEISTNLEQHYDNVDGVYESPCGYECRQTECGDVPCGCLSEASPLLSRLLTNPQSIYCEEDQTPLALPLPHD